MQSALKTKLREVVDVERVPGPELRKLIQAIIDYQGLTIYRDERGEYLAQGIDPVPATRED